jgi:hypothetical protein
LRFAKELANSYEINKSRRAGIGQPGQDSRDRRARTVKPEQDSRDRDRTAGRRQPGQDSREKTAGTGQPERTIGIIQLRKKRTAGTIQYTETGQPGETATTVRPGKDSGAA